MKLLAVKRMVLPLSYRDFRFLWIGQTISALGNPFQVVALVWLVLEIKGSPLALATMLLALAIPQAVVTLAGGVLIDRFDARTVMLWSDVVRTVTSGTIAILAFSDRLPLWLLFSILLFHGTANGLFSPAAASIPPRLVPKEALDSANSLMSLISQLGTFLGAIPAGIIIASHGPALAFALNSFSFAIAVLAALLMKPLSRETRSKKSSLFQDAVQGFVYLWRFPWLITILVMDSCAAIAAIGPIAIGLPLLASNVLRIGSQGYSLLLGSFGCGSVIGILLPAIRSPRHHRGRFFCLVQLLEAPLLAGVAFVPLPLAMLCLVGVGLLNGFLIVLFLSLLQTNIAKEMLGRMMSFWMLASMGFVPLSQYASGLIANFAGIQALFTTAGILTLLGAVLGLLVPSMHHLD